MQDIVDKVDRAKAILLPLITTPGAEPSKADAEALAAIGIDLIGEFVANSRRSATALEKLASPSIAAEMVSAEIGSLDSPALTSIAESLAKLAGNVQAIGSTVDGAFVIAKA